MSLFQLISTIEMQPINERLLRPERFRRNLQTYRTSVGSASQHQTPAVVLLTGQDK
jgi:hypothetical protein